MKTAAGDVIAGITLVSSGFDLYQTSNIADTEKKRSLKLHSESVNVATKLHEENLRIIKQAYLIESIVSLEQHFQQLNADLSHNAKESERDMFDQRNQQYQTIILSSSVMFAALSTVIIQGILPNGASSFICIAYALTTSLSFAFLFLCIVLCIEIVSRASQFMYKRSIKHTDNLKRAVDTTENAIKNMRQNQKKSKQDNDDNEDEEKFQERWNAHEHEMFRMMNERENINREVAYFHNQSVNDDQIPFEDFWNNSCKIWGKIAILFFYAGTYNLLLAIMLYVWSSFYLHYESISGAIIAMSCIGSALFIGAIMLLVFKVNNNNSGNGNNNNNNNSNKLKSSFKNQILPQSIFIPSDSGLSSKRNSLDSLKSSNIENDDDINDMI